MYIQHIVSSIDQDIGKSNIEKEQHSHGSVVSQVNTIIYKAIDQKASDIHLESDRKSVV